MVMTAETRSRSDGAATFQLELAERYWRRGQEKKGLEALSRLQVRFPSDAGVLSAIDVALWDLAGLRAGRPISELLGGTADRLPTYASWLNPIEKLWRWAKQTLSHARPYCDNFTEFKAQLNACLDTAATMSAYIRHYCGLSSFKVFL